MAQTDYKTLCIELFGTDDEQKIREICKKQKLQSARNAGRKRVLTAPKESAIKTMAAQGYSLQEIATRFKVSRKTVSQFLNTRPSLGYTVRLDYKEGPRINTVIFADPLEKKVQIQNRTDDVLGRAFGMIEEPSWKDFEHFISSRCFPPSRGYAKAILQTLGTSGYDPLQIIEATDGRTAEDNMHIKVRHYRRGAPAHADD